MLCLVVQLCPTLCNPIDYSLPDSSVHGDSPGKNTGVGCHAFLQGISPTQGSNPGLPHYRQILYQLSHQGSPIMCISSVISVQSLSRVWLFATPWIAACQTSLSIMCIAIPKWLTVMAERKTILLKFLASLWKDSFAHKSLSWGGVILKIFIYLYRWASTSHSGASINKNSHRSVSTATLIHGEQIPLLQQKLYHISVACYAASYAPAQLVLCLLLLWVLV